MILLISEDRPADQNCNLFHIILGEQLLKLTAIDMKTALINEMLDIHAPNLSNIFAPPQFMAQQLQSRKAH